MDLHPDYKSFYYLRKYLSFQDEETTINAVRNAVKTERKTYISRPARGPPGSAEAAELPPSLTTTTAMANTQQIEVNKFVDKYRSR